MYTIAEMERFDADFRMQLHFNSSATQTTPNQKQAINATRASQLRDVDLDALLENTSTLSVISSKWQELSCYVLEDILDCPVGSRFIVCIAVEDKDDNRCRYYTNYCKNYQRRLEPRGFARGDVEDIKQEILDYSGQDQQNITLP